MLAERRGDGRGRPGPAEALWPGSAPAAAEAGGEFPAVTIQLSKKPGVNAADVATVPSPASRR